MVNACKKILILVLEIVSAFFALAGVEFISFIQKTESFTPFVIAYCAAFVLLGIGSYFFDKKIDTSKGFDHFDYCQDIYILVFLWTLTVRH